MPDDLAREAPPDSLCHIVATSMSWQGDPSPVRDKPLGHR